MITDDVLTNVSRLIAHESHRAACAVRELEQTQLMNE